MRSWPASGNKMKTVGMGGLLHDLDIERVGAT